MRRTLALLLPLLVTCTAAPPPPVAPPPPPAPTAPATAAFEETPDDPLWSATPPVTPTPEARLALLQEVRVAGGVRATLAERHEAPLCAVVAMIRRSAPGADAALASLLLDTRDAAGLPLRDRLGFAVEAGTHHDYSSITWSIASSELETSLRAFVDALRRGSPSAERVEAERRRALLALDQRGAEEKLLAEHDAWLYPAGHRYHDPAGGSEDQLKKLQPREVEAHRAKITPDQLVLSVAGDVSAEALRGVLERVTADWKPARAAGPRPPRLTSGALLVYAPEESTRVVISTAAPRLHASDPVLDMAQHMIVYVLPERMRSRIQALTGGDARIRTRVDPRTEHPRVLTFVDLHGPHLAAVVQAYFDALAAIARGEVTDQEMPAAREKLVTWLTSSLETTRRAAEYHTYPALFEVPPASVADRLRAVNAMRGADLQRIATAHLAQGEARITAVGDVASAKDDLVRLKLGPVTVRKPAPKRP